MRQVSARKSKKSRKKISRRQKAKYLKIAFLSMLAFLFLGLIYLYRVVDQNVVSAFDESPYSSIVDRTNYTLSVSVLDDFSKEIPELLSQYFLIFDFVNNKVLRFKIPPELTLDFPGRLGPEKIKNCFRLATLSNSAYKRGDELLLASMQKLFGLPVDRYLLIESSKVDIFERFLYGRLGLDFDIIRGVLKTGISTNLSFPEITHTYKLIKGYPRERIMETAMSDYFIENPHVLDEIIQDVTFDSYLSGENLSITILNATDIPGAASNIARLIENSGGRVVSVDNSLNLSKNSLIITDMSDSATVRFLSTLYDNPRIVSKSDATEYYDREVVLSDVIFYIGFDLAKGL